MKQYHVEFILTKRCDESLFSHVILYLIQCDSIHSLDQVSCILLLLSTVHIVDQYLAEGGGQVSFCFTISLDYLEL